MFRNTEDTHVLLGINEASEGSHEKDNKTGKNIVDDIGSIGVHRETNEHVSGGGVQKKIVQNENIENVDERYESIYSEDSNENNEEWENEEWENEECVVQGNIEEVEKNDEDVMDNKKKLFPDGKIMVAIVRVCLIVMKNEWHFFL